jgi:hypothetical protein
MLMHLMHHAEHEQAEHKATERLLLLLPPLPNYSSSSARYTRTLQQQLSTIHRHFTAAAQRDTPVLCRLEPCYRTVQQ